MFSTHSSLSPREGGKSGETASKHKKICHTIKGQGLAFALALVAFAFGLASLAFFVFAFFVLSFFALALIFSIIFWCSSHHWKRL